MYSPVRGTNSTHVQKPQIFIKVLPNKNTFEHCTHTIHTYMLNTLVLDSYVSLYPHMSLMVRQALNITTKMNINTSAVWKILC